MRRVRGKGSGETESKKMQFLKTKPRGRFSQTLSDLVFYIWIYAIEFFRRVVFHAIFQPGFFFFSVGRLCYTKREA